MNFLSILVSSVSFKKTGSFNKVVRSKTSSMYLSCLAAEKMVSSAKKVKTRRYVGGLVRVALGNHEAQHKS